MLKRRPEPVATPACNAVAVRSRLRRLTNARGPIIALASLAFAAGCKRASEDATSPKPAPTAPVSPGPASPAPAPAAATPSIIKHVFVVAMENSDAAEIYGDAAVLPYISGTLLAEYAHAVAFRDELPLSIPSEPHYIWIEGGPTRFPTTTS